MTEQNIASAVAPPGAPAVTDYELAWRQSPFRILVCMPFRVPEVERAWRERLQPALQRIGSVLRLDWTTDDWVRDIRRLLGEASFLLIDLSAANINVRRELRFVFDSKLQPLCYAHSATKAEPVSTVGLLHPAIAVNGEKVDLKMWGQRVSLVNYEDASEIGELLTMLEREMQPFRDLQDPTSAYVGSDLAALPPSERLGFELARTPRVIASGEQLLKEGRALFADSAIFRARIFSWLANPNLFTRHKKNLWLRDHLVQLVLDDVRAGHRLSPEERTTIEWARRQEYSQTLQDFLDDCLSIAGRTAIEPPAHRNGLPAPQGRSLGLQQAELLALDVELVNGVEPGGLRAASWRRTFRSGVKMLCQPGVGQHQKRVFAWVGPTSGASDCNPGEVEDLLDRLAGELSTIALDMGRNGWTESHVEVFLQTAISLAVLREMRRRRVFESGPAKEPYDVLAADLGYIWERPAGEFRLFEFSSKSEGTHFRGLFPWSDVKESAVWLFARECASVLRDKNITEQQIFDKTMKGDYPPPQLWDAVMRRMMCDVVSEDVMRELWAKYVLPSAFFYWPRDQVYTSPMKTALWAYVKTQTA